MKHESYKKKRPHIEWFFSGVPRITRAVRPAARGPARRAAAGSYSVCVSNLGPVSRRQPGHRRRRRVSRLPRPVCICLSRYVRGTVSLRRGAGCP
jgi:hypothetical protein